MTSKTTTTRGSGKAATPADVLRMARQMAAMQEKMAAMQESAGNAALSAYVKALEVEAKETKAVETAREKLAKARESRRAIGAMVPADARKQALEASGLQSTRKASGTGTSKPDLPAVPDELQANETLSKAFETGAKKPGKPCAYVSDKAGNSLKSRVLAYEWGQREAGVDDAGIVAHRASYATAAKQAVADTPAQ